MIKAKITLDMIKEAYNKGKLNSLKELLQQATNNIDVAKSAAIPKKIFKFFQQIGDV